ncbi:hypothetical protein RCL1_006860 [Eukaryota sp. TZLM3-RCL]
MARVLFIFLFCFISCSFAVSQFSDYLHTFNESGQKSLRILPGSSTSQYPDSLLVRHQVVFLIDVTGSMQPFIDGCKNQVRSFIDRLRSDAEERLSNLARSKRYQLSFEVAIVAYRDFSDIDHFEVHDFTDNMTSIYSFLSSLTASGGFDAPEDVLGGFLVSLFDHGKDLPSLSWENSSASKTIIWLSDAPPHGLSFHNLGVIGDNYPQDYCNLWNIVFNELRDRNINLFVVKVNNQLSAAINTFNKLAEKRDYIITAIDLTQYFESFNHYEPRVAAMYMRGEGEDLFDEVPEGMVYGDESRRAPEDEMFDEISPLVSVKISRSSAEYLVRNR